MLLLYGLLILFIFIFVLHTFFNVYYTPGVSVLYDTPLSQRFFPFDYKLWPTWGYDGKRGYGKWWPREGRGYQPTKYGSTGADPEGGLRPRGTIPLSVDIGWWGGQSLR